MTIPLKEPEFKMVCPRCGEEWTQLTKIGLCVECKKAVDDQKERDKNTKPVGQDLKARASGENTAHQEE